MNKIYKLVWSKVRNTWVVASEIAKGHGKNASATRERKLLKTAVITAIMGGCLMTGGLASAALTAEQQAVYDAVMAKLEERGGNHYVSVNPLKKEQTAGSNYENDGAKGDGGIAIGEDATSQGRGIAVGYKSKAVPKTGATVNPNAFEGIAIGEEAYMEVPGGIAIGLRSKVEGTLNAKDGNVNELGTIALGTDSYAKGLGAAAFGWKAKGNGEGAMAFGTETEAKESGTAFGAHAIAAAGGVAMGWQAHANDRVATSVGTSSDAAKQATAVGAGTTADGIASTAVGLGAVSKGVLSTALGGQSVAEEANSIALGAGAVANTKAGAVGYIATGSSVTFEDALKTLNKKEDYAKWTAKVNESKAEYENLTNAFNDARTKDEKAEAKAALDAWKGQHADFIEALTAKEKLEATWRATKAAVSVGADGVDKAGNRIIESRQITNVAAGTRDTDAVNVAQLKALDTKVEGNKIHYLSIGPDNEKNLAQDGNYNNDGADSHWGIAIGVNASSKGGGSIAIGKGSQAHGTEEHRAQGVSIGSASRAIGAFATAVGHDTKAFGERSVAYGLGEAYGRGSIAIGSGAVAALKEGITKEEYDKLSDEEKAWYGKADYDDQKIFYQFRQKGKDGKVEDIKNYGMAIGSGATSFDNAGLAVGLNAKTNKDFGVALGGYSENKVEQGVALGTKSVADRAKDVKGYLPTTGKAIENFEEAMKATGKETAFKELKVKYLAAQEKLTKAQEAYKADQSPTNMMNLDKAQKELEGLTEEYAIMTAPWTSRRGAVSVGNDKTGYTRQITGVAAGSEDTDAVNVAQLKVVNAKVDQNKTDITEINKKITNLGESSDWTLAVARGDDSKTENEATVEGTSKKVSGGTVTLKAGRGVKLKQDGTNVQIGLKYIDMEPAGGTFNDAKATAGGALAVGQNSVADGHQGTAVGFETHAGDYAFAGGSYANAKGNGSVGIGYNAIADGESAVAIGSGRRIDEDDPGSAYRKVESDNATAVGSEAVIDNQSEQSTALGVRAEAVKSAGSAALGSFAKVENSNYSTAVGNGTLVRNSQYGTALGNFAVVSGTEGGVALGSHSLATRKSGGVGYNLTNTPWRDLNDYLIMTGQIEAYTKADAALTAAKKELAADPDNYDLQAKVAKATAERNAIYNSWISTNGAVSIGNEATGITRQLTGLAAGTKDTDAVNVAQLKAVNTKVDKNTTDITELTTKIKNAGGVHYFSVNSDDKNASGGTNWDNDGATGEDAIAIGRKARAYGLDSQSMGENAWSIGNYSQAWGYYALAGAEEGISKAAYDALSEEEKKNYALRELRIGGEDKSLYYRTTFKEYTNDEFMALPEQERRDLQSKKGYGYHSGKKVWTPTPRAIAIGHLSKALGAATVAVGNLAEATGLQSTAIGTQANAAGEHSFAAGDRAKAQKTGTVAIGMKTNASGEWSTSVGSFAEASGEWGTALGLSAKAQSENGVALGASTLVDKKDAVSLGYKAKGKVESGVALGAYSVADREKGKIGYALGGDNSTLEKALESIGQKAKYDELTGKIDPLKDEYNGLMKAYQDAPANSAEETTAKQKLDAWIAGHPDFLPAVKEKQQMTGAWQSGNGAVSVGKAGATRQITHVAAGSEDTDAVNVAQLKVVNEKADKNAADITNLTKTVNDNGKATKVTVDGKEESTDGNLKITKKTKDGQTTYDLSLNDELTIGKDGKDGKIGINGKDGTSAEITVGKGEPGVDGKDGVTRIIYKDKDGKNHEVATLDDGLKFKGDNNDVVIRKLNTQLNIEGGAKADELSDNNIGVVGTAGDNGGMKVKLSKNLKGLTSAEFKDGDNITNITAGDISITKKEGDKTKTLNIWELKEKVEAGGKATKVTVDGKEENADGNLKITKKTENGQTTYDLTLNDELTIGKDGKDGKIGINGKDGTSAEITVGKGEPGVDGKDGVTRIIYKDKDGKEHEVATLDDGLKFKGDNDTVVTRKLNQQLNITGGIKNDADLSDGNIGIVGTQDGGMEVKLSKKLKGLSSAEFKDGDNITNITAGDISITKKEGDETKTLNIWELKEKVEANGKATKVMVDGKENKADGNLKITKKEKDGQATYDISLSNQLDLKEKGSIKLGDHKKRGVVINGNEIGVLDYEKNENSVVISSKAGIAVGNPNSRIQIKGDRIDMGGKNIYNLKDGEISETSKQAVNGSQLHATNTRVTNLETKVTNIETTVNNIDQKIEQKIEGSKITVDGDKDTGVKATAIKNGDKVTGYKVSLDKKVTVGNVTIDGTGEGTDKKGEITGLTNTTLDGNDFATKGRAATEEQLKAAMGKAMAQSRTTVKGSENITVKPETKGASEYTVELAKDITVDSVTAKTVKADEYKVGDKTYINKDGINANGNKIINVGDGKISKDSTDAVNGKQLYGVEQKVNQNTTNINKLQNNIYDMGMKVGELDTRVNKVGAGAAALAALHPQDFDPEDKWDIAAGVGNYKNATAAAVGLFYRPNERTMLNLGWTMGDSRNMVNAGVSVKLGSGSTYAGLSKVQMATRLTQQEEKITAQEQEIKELREREEQREKQIQEILSKLEMIEKAKA